MVSWRLCQKLVELGVHEEREILIIGEERQLAYDRVNLTKYFDLKSPDELLLSEAAWYAEHGIRLLTSRRVVKLDRVSRTVLDDAGQLYNFSDCVLATGSRPYVPRIEGVDAKNIFVYRTIDDIEAIREAALISKRGLVLGGGLLGLEAADVLNDFDVETTVVQSANSLMSRQLNEDGGSCLLGAVAKLGMRVRLKASAERITPSDAGLEVSFRKGEPMTVDMIVIATGIQARDELAKDAGLATAARGGIIINDKLQTEDPHVYAIGECASHRGKVYGLVSPGYEMADVLARRFARKKAKYAGSDESCRLKLLGVEVSVFGDYMQDGSYHVFRGEGSYRSLVLDRKNRMIGATVVGPWQQTADVERGVRENLKLSKKQIADFERGRIYLIPILKMVCLRGLTIPLFVIVRTRAAVN